MLWVEGAWAVLDDLLTVQLTVQFDPQNGYIPWKGLNQAKPLTVRIDSKIKGFLLTR
jgi:hypothetical protein